MRGHHISFFFFFFTKLVTRHLDLIVSENHIPNSQYFKMRIKQNGKKNKNNISIESWDCNPLDSNLQPPFRLLNRPLCVTFPLKSKELKSQEVHWIRGKFLSDPSSKPRAGPVLKFPKMKWPGFTSIIKVSHLLSLQEQKIWLVRIKANLTQNIRRYVML